ncbi:MAG: hypothetical protein JSV17_12630 [Candidatus Aminicenantes bacterium]|nr:MAG: hypothetical protein JSV17_12630 [Candidatus Aminicenantes bacterium]
MIQLIEKNDATPICPHCSAPITALAFRELRAFLGRRYIYFCAQCNKVLGISHRKGFWMG